jgi:O-methyltransferase
MRQSLKSFALNVVSGIFGNEASKIFFPNSMLSVAANKRQMMRFMPNESLIDRTVTSSGDPIRYAMIALAINRIAQENIAGDFAELGVYRGDTSRVIHHFAPTRTLYLFDTFEGFSEKDEQNASADKRFNDTNVELVKANIGDVTNVVIKKGYFPETATGLEDKRFAFVMLDADKYAPTLAGLEFFYSRMSHGGYIFLHDYNSPESEWGVSRALNLFLQGKPETIVDIPDTCGSVLIRKV